MVECPSHLRSSTVVLPPLRRNSASFLRECPSNLYNIWFWKLTSYLSDCKRYFSIIMHITIYMYMYIEIFINISIMVFNQYLMQRYLKIQQEARKQQAETKTQQGDFQVENQRGTFSHHRYALIPIIHFVETAPSVLRELPWILLKEHKVQPMFCT